MDRLEERRRKSREYAARKYAANPEAHREKSGMWRAANPEKVKEKNARWRAANPERAKEKSARYYRENTERINANQARWRKENPEKHRAAIKRWSAANPDARRALAARWSAANPEKVRVRGSRRRARKRNALHTEHSAEIETVLFQSAARLRKCLGIDFHLDHITPLARGGKHHHANLRVLPGYLNNVKHDKLDSELPSNLQTAIKQWTPYLN